MLGIILSVSVYFLMLADGLEIIQPPPDSIWVRESETVELSCKSDQPWQWCYWEIIATDGSANQNTRYQAYQGSSSYINPSMRFLTNETVCGLEITSAKSDLHNGKWKCHLADTDIQEQIKAEAFVQLNVGVEGKPTLLAKIPEKGINLNYQENILLGTLLTISCSTQLTRSNPFPSFKIWLVAKDGHSKQLLAKSLSDPGGATLENFELTKEDQGKYFICETIQTADDVTLFNNFVSGEPLQLVYPPMLDVFSHPQYEFVNQSLLIQIPFSSKPAPQEYQLEWSIHPLYFNGTGQNVNKLQNEQTEMYKAYPVQKSEVTDEYFANIGIINMTESVEITLTVWNDFGELKHSFVVNFAAPLPPPDESTDSVVGAGIALWIIVLIAVSSIVLLLVTLLLMVCVKQRSEKKKNADGNISQINSFGEIQSDSWSRRKPGEAGSTPMSLHDTRKGGKDKRNGRKQPPATTRIDLDLIPDNELPMLEKIYTDATGAAPFLHRSLSDENSNDNDVVDSKLKKGAESKNGIPEENYNADDDDDDDLDFFNEKLLDIRNTDPDVLGSMEDLEPGLVVVRQNPNGNEFKVVEDQKFFTGSEQIVMTTGPTSYPVVTSPTSRTSFFPSPSYIPGRRTTQIDFLQQSEQQNQSQIQQSSNSNSLKKPDRKGTFSRR